MRIILVSALLALLGLIPVLFLEFQPQSDQPTLGQDQVRLKRSDPMHVGNVLANYGARTASAAMLDARLESTLDTVADQVYGQADFTTGTAAMPATDSSLNQPRDIAIYSSGQVFVADTANNRVLGWNCIYNYENGDFADVVLGQPDFATTTTQNPPTASSMNGPTGVTVGFDGFLYVSDTGNNRVLVFSPTNYDAYVADEPVFYDPNKYYCEDGSQLPSDFYAPLYTNGQEADYALGQPNFVSGSALPTGAETLNQPMGLVTDVNDNLVVADHGNNRVLIYEWNDAGGIGPSAIWVIGQEIAQAGNDTFLNNAAPNPPTQRSMSGPTDVAAGVLGNEVYVADTGNNRILIFNDNPPDTIADGIIGQPDYTSNSPNNGGLSAASLATPSGVQIDAGNRIYVADTGNSRVLTFDQTTPDGVADGIFGQPNYTSNTVNNGGISASSLSAPTGLASDIFYADVYIVDTGNNRALEYNQPLPNPVPVIAEMDPGTIRASAGGFTLGIWGTGIISDTVVEINGVSRTIGSEFLGFTEVEIAASELTTTGQFTITLRNPAPGGGVSAPIPFTIYAPTPGDDLADSVLGQKGFTTADGPFAPVRADTIDSPTGVVVDPRSGRLFVSDLGNARVLSWPSSQARADGAPADLVLGKPDFTTYLYDAAPGLTLVRPAGLALDSAGNLYVADAAEGFVSVYTAPFTNSMPAALIISGLNNPLALSLDSQDNLYVADTFNHRVLFFEKPLASRNTAPDRVFGQPNLSSTAPNGGGAISAQGLHFPSGVAVDKAGNLYIADSNNHRMLVYLDPLNTDATADQVIGQAGSFTTGVANKGGLSAESLNYPYGLLVDEYGNLYVADADNNRVLGYTAPLTTDTVADLVIGQSSALAQNNNARSRASLRGPTNVALTPDGDLFVADNGNNRVLGFRAVKLSQTQWNLFLPGVRR
jgi:sugar lactone lactonase YvrE